LVLSICLYYHWKNAATSNATTNAISTRSQRRLFGAGTVSEDTGGFAEKNMAAANARGSRCIFNSLQFAAASDCVEVFILILIVIFILIPPFGARATPGLRLGL
jgi:hypothetical protein